MSAERRELAMAYLDLLDGPIGPDPGPLPSATLLGTPPAWTLHIDVLAGQLPGFDQRYRDAGDRGGLEFTRGERGVHAYDPDATHLLVMAIDPNGRCWRVGVAESAALGVELFAPLGEEARVRLVALASLGPLEPRLCATWLERLHASGQDPASSEHIHVAHLDVGPQTQPQIALAVERHPPTPAPVQALLSAAASAGRAGRHGQALDGYAAVLAHPDAGGLARVKAGLGKATFLSVLGFTDDARRALLSVTRSEPLDRASAAMVARKLASLALSRMDVAQAKAWVDEALDLQPDSPPGLLLRSQVLLHSGMWTQAVDAIDALPPAASSNPSVAPALLAQRALCDVQCGRVSPGLSASAALLDRDDLHLEARLWCLRAWAAGQAARGANPWDRVCEQAEQTTRAAGVLTSACRRMLAVLSGHAAAAGAHQPASRLLSLRFGVAADRPGLRVAAVPDGLVVANGHGQAALRRVSPQDLQLLRASVRAEWTRNQPASATASVLALLQLPDTQLALVACDGSLAGLPVTHLLAPGTPALRVHQTVRAQRARLHDRIVSVADAQGDLPGARAEVPDGPGTERHVGRKATWAQVQAAERVGLLHLGVHADRQDGVATLHFADRAVGPAQIAALELRGGPVVLLGGCGTAPHAGAERALAVAFRQAGASAVIATHWPMKDGELHLITHRLLDRWPFTDVPYAVASVVRELRAEGHPRRLWGSVVVL